MTSFGVVTTFGVRPIRLRAQRLLALAVALATAALALSSAMNAHAAGPQLLRNPYLTDDSSNHAMLELATNTQSPAVNVTYGQSPGCTGSSINRTGTPITVNGVSEYQFKFPLTNLAAGTLYCYTVVQSGVTLYDNSGGRTAFHTAMATTDTRPYSFAVFGDWGSVPNGSNPQLAKLMNQVHSSGASFAVTAGDNAYNSGTQTNYGDLLQSGPNVSAIFAQQFWGQNGATTPLFMDPGDHGFSIPITYFLNFDATATAADSVGKYASENYSGGPDGVTSTNYPSVWYAFNWGNARFYVLSGVWGDTNLGSATGSACTSVVGGRPCPNYQVDYDYHWAPGSPELTWLTNDLRSHASTPIKFAFFHFPLHVDNNTEQSNPYYGGDNGLEALLADNHVTASFNGKAHLYERNLPQVGSMVSYVTGGGGAPLEPVTTCSSFDGYSRGWSVTNSVASECHGTGTPPSTQDEVNEFLLVTVNGNNVTVAPTDSNGHQFDVQTYTVSMNSGSATQFQLSVPQGATAGAAFNETITAQDASGNTDMTYNGNRPITWSGLSNSPNGTAPVYPDPVVFSNGRATVRVTSYAAQTTSLTASDGDVSGTSGSFSIKAAATSAITMPSAATTHGAGTSFKETITAVDPWGNSATSFTGTKSITWSGPGVAPNGKAPTLPSTVLFGSTGTTSPSVTLYKAEKTALTATVSGFTATSGPITITPSTAKSLSIPTPGPQTAGVPFALSLTAVDAYGNTVTAYSGKKAVAFSGPSTSPSGKAPRYYPIGTASVNFVSGSGSTTVTLYAAETTSIHAACCGTSPTVTGATGNLTVAAGPTASLSLAIPSTATAGIAATASVTALDIYGNVATGDGSTLTVSSTDSLCDCSATPTLSNGVVSFSFTMNTPGPQSLSVEESSGPSASADTTVGAASGSPQTFGSSR